MIAKKDSRFDLERNRAGLIQIGLLTAGAFTLAAFTYRSPIDYEENNQRIGTSSVEIEIEEIQKPKEQEVKLKPEPIQRQEEPMVKAEMDPNQNIKETKSTLEMPKFTPTFTTDKFKLGNENIYVNKKIEAEPIETPDIDAEFVGKYPAMMAFIQSKVKYPEISVIMRHEGTVVLSFIVEEDGSITHVKVVKSLTPELDREAKRIVKSFPNWIPGEVNFAPVRTRVHLPITFELGD